VPDSISGAARAVHLQKPEGPLRPVVARFNDETITVQNWPAKDKHLVIAEFHY